jgi:hypothetical protein
VKLEDICISIEQKIIYNKANFEIKKDEHILVPLSGFTCCLISAISNDLPLPFGPVNKICSSFLIYL